jgi:hypothetical protein
VRKSGQSYRGAEDYAHTYVATTKDIISLSCPVAFCPKLIAGTSYIIKKVSSSPEGNIRLTGSSIVMQCGKIMGPPEKLAKFYEPEKCTVQEAVSSPKKRRLSCVGYVQQVSDVIVHGTTKRRIIDVSSVQKGGMSEPRIVVKLWGEDVNKATPTEQSKVVITCLEGAEFGQFKELNATTLTKFEKESGTDVISGIVEACDFDEQAPKILLADVVYDLSSIDLLDTIFPTRTYSAKTVTATVNGNTIQTIKEDETNTEEDETSSGVAHRL